MVYVEPLEWHKSLVSVSIHSDYVNISQYQTRNVSYFEYYIKVLFLAQKSFFSQTVYLIINNVFIDELLFSKDQFYLPKTNLCVVVKNIKFGLSKTMDGTLYQKCRRSGNIMISWLRDKT